jgi:tetrahydromethanopterin S-methyltransferase subunit G
VTQATPESFEQIVLGRFDAIDRRLDTVDSRIDAVDSRLNAVDSRLGSIDADIKATNSKVEKWDSRLWGLTLALIVTAWAGIVGATAVVITRSLMGS